MTTGTEVVATADDLPPPVAAALASPGPGEDGAAHVAGRRWTFLRWGSPHDPPLLLVHGVTSNARTWWRVGPALAAAGRHVVAIDMPGHGPDATWDGRHRFVETAEGVAGYISEIGLAAAGLAVVGHSWGGMVGAHLPQVGVRPVPLVLLDPPWLSLEQLKTLTLDPTEQRYDSLGQATSAVRAMHPNWSDGDVEAKAVALTEFDGACVRAVLLQNGSWDAGMAALRHPDAAGLPVWLIRGDSSSGGLIPETAMPAIRTQLEQVRVLTIAGGSHSPQRTHPEATVLAILRALAKR